MSAAAQQQAAQRRAAMAVQKQHERERQERRIQEHWDSTPIAPARLMAALRVCLPANTVLFNEAITATSDLLRTHPIGATRERLWQSRRWHWSGSARSPGSEARLSRPTRRGPGRRWLVDVLGAEFLDRRTSPYSGRLHYPEQPYLSYLEVQHEPLSAYARYPRWASLYRTWI